jgi:hypothetical protein
MAGFGVKVDVFLEQFSGEANGGEQGYAGNETN